LSVTGLDFGDRLRRMLASVEATVLEEAAEVVAQDQREGAPTFSGKLKQSHQLVRTADGFESGFTAGHGLVIDRGRKRSKPYKVTRKGTSFEVKRRMLGSKEAPRGMSRGAIRELRRQWNDVVARAAARAEGS
jgi:hypothetical protein